MWPSYAVETAIDVAKLCSGDCSGCGQVMQLRLQWMWPSYAVETAIDVAKLGSGDCSASHLMLS